MQHLAPARARFRQLAESGPDPRVADLWDWENGVLKTDRFEDYLGYASSGEEVYARFLALIWFRSNHYGFDLATAIDRLDYECRMLIVTHILAPIRP
ncbi:hypothetical protein DLJ49_20350 [Rhodovulum sp. 12E13]|uniref:hypothetical protein n=1 Tax=Rhodovulum sp. 12E13 TaxID=2203891 RepID=UPI000E1A35FD|nr:hypothetical protein [Rhodovulum sp. 12E13]RDC68042.1 hypothetical protein DLJ49_20350 [Rhodovulum sp. 12E13]